MHGVGRVGVADVLHLAHTSDGLSFTDDGPLSFDKIDATNPTMNYDATRFIGPRGTIEEYIDGTYGMFFSGGNCGDGDSDAYHYMGRSWLGVLPIWANAAVLAASVGQAPGWPGL